MELHVQKKYFDAIKIGTKVYEGRLGKDKYRLPSIGSVITFSTDGGESIEKTISSIHIFATFHEAGKALGIQKILPGIDSIHDMVDIYRQFYPEIEEKKHNVVMIGIT